jgi:hypothetical protein
MWVSVIDLMTGQEYRGSQKKIAQVIGKSISFLTSVHKHKIHHFTTNKSHYAISFEYTLFKQDKGYRIGAGKSYKQMMAIK